MKTSILKVSAIITLFTFSIDAQNLKVASGGLLYISPNLQLSSLGKIQLLIQMVNLLWTPFQMIFRIFMIFSGSSRGFSRSTVITQPQSQQEILFHLQ